MEIPQTRLKMSSPNSNKMVFPRARRVRRVTRNRRARRVGQRPRMGRRLADVGAVPRPVRRTLPGVVPLIQGNTIAQIVTKDRNFSTLSSLVEKAGLDKVLNERDKNFTVFAPTNAAFAKLDKKTFDLLTSAAGEEKLKDILLYHVLPEKFMSNQVEGINVKNTALTDEILCIHEYNGRPEVNDAKIIKADIFAANGVIHVIDTVLAQPRKTCDQYGHY